MSAAAGKTRQQPTVTVNPRTFLGPQTAPGESGNRAANAFSGITMTEVCDWGTGRLVAYAHFTLVVVADPGSAQVVTTLDHHTADVTCIRFLDPLRSGDRVLLASGDTTGNLVVWDVSAGTPIVVTSCVAPTDAQRFPDLCKIVAMRQIRVPKYASESSIARTMSSQIDVPVRLLVMTPRSLVLMDVTSQTTVWKRDLGTSDCPLVGLSLNSRGDVMIMNTASTLKLLSRVGSPGSSKEITSVNVSDLGELQQAVYCPSVRSLAYLVFRNEVVLYDLEIRRCISDDTFKLSSGRRSEFRGLIQASGAEASALSTVLGLSGCLTLYTIHNDGTLNAWSRRPNGILASASVDFRSSRQGYSGRPYLIAAERISGGELAAGPEGSFARFSVVSNDGTLATWDHTIDGWNLVNSIPSTQGPVSHLAVLRLDVHASEARLPAGIENCIVMLGTTGHLSIYDLLTGAIICKVELMTERGCTSVGLEGLSTTSIVVAGTRPATGDNSHYNFICIVHLGSLRVDELKGRDAESCRLSSVEVSGTKTHLVACHTAEVLEVWDLAGRWLLSKLSYPYTLVTWLPVPKGKNPRNEAFIWLSSDGVMSFFRVKNGEAKPYPTNPSFMQTKKKIIVGFGNPVLTADWFGELLLTGDAAGMMFLVNLKTAKFSYIENHQKSVIKQLSICPTKYIEVAPDVSAAEGQKRRNVCLALVLFEDQEFGVWDIGEKHRMSFSKGPDQKSRSLKATSVGWITGPFPVIATPTGTVTILDLALGSSCSAVTLRSLARPLRTTAFLVRPHAAYLMACLMNGFVDGASNLSSEKPKATSSSAATNDYPENPDSASTYASVQPPYRNAFGELVTKPIKTQADEIVGHLQLVPEHVKDTIRSLSEDEPDDIALRCLIAAAVFAEPTKMEFWRSVAVALKAAKGAPRPRFVHPTIATKNKTQHDAQQQQQQLQQQQRLSNSVSPVGTPPSQDLDPTDAPLEALLDGFTVGAHDELFLDDGLLHAIDCKSTAEKEMAAKASKATIHYATIAQHHVKLGSMTPAVSLLLDTPQDAPEWKANLYKACVVAAGVSTLNYQHTVKRVASMLISNSDIEGAVELLCLIGRGYDACRAYQTHDKWDEAARLAKVSLSASEARDILKRWADHLSSCGETLNAACVLVSCGDFISALRTLGPHAEFCDLAALLAVACDRSGIIEEALPANPELPAFVKSLYLQHKEYLHSISASRIASHYSGLAQECYLRYERAARPPPEVPQEVAQESSA